MAVAEVDANPLHDVAVQLLDCVVDQIRCYSDPPECPGCEANSEDCTAIFIAAEGAAPPIDCCGAIYASVVRTYFHDGNLNRYGGPGSPDQCCPQALLAVDIEVGVRRCIRCLGEGCGADITDDIDPVGAIDDDARTYDAAEIAADHYGLMAGVVKFLGEYQTNCRVVVVGDFERVGGACCYGTTTTVTVDVGCGVCPCPEEEGAL